VADRSVVLHSDSGSWPLARPWVPLSADPVDERPTTRAVIAVESQRPIAPPPPVTGLPTLTIGPATAWLEAGVGLLRGASGCWGRLDLELLRGTLFADPQVGDAATADLYAMLTIASALLLGRMGRAVIHAGAIVAPDGRGWLVVGDARSGKSTTCVSLASAGCGLLSDDQVVLSTDGPSLVVEGWLRPVHLDEGWGEGIPQGPRQTLHPAALGAVAPCRVAPLAGTVHTVVDPAQPTRVSRLSAGDGFTGLVRQSPWLLADRVSAPALVDLLSRVARLPRLSLRLGLDTFGRPERIRALLTPALS
jgi:hypothetical protein